MPLLPAGSGLASPNNMGVQWYVQRSASNLIQLLLQYQEVLLQDYRLLRHFIWRAPGSTSDEAPDDPNPGESYLVSAIHGHPWTYSGMISGMISIRLIEKE